MNGNLTLTSTASFTSTSGNMTVSGDVSNSSTSTFNANSGTLILDNLSAQSIDMGGDSVYDLTINAVPVESRVCFQDGECVSDCFDDQGDGDPANDDWFLPSFYTNTCTDVYDGTIDTQINDDSPGESDFDSRRIFNFGNSRVLNPDGQGPDSGAALLKWSFYESENHVDTGGYGTYPTEDRTFTNPWIPVKSTITQLQFQFHMTTDTNAESGNIYEIYNLTKDWVEGTRGNSSTNSLTGAEDDGATGATFYRYNTTDNWETAGALGPE